MTLEKPCSWILEMKRLWSNFPQMDLQTKNILHYGKGLLKSTVTSVITARSIFAQVGQVESGPEVEVTTADIDARRFDPESRAVEEFHAEAPTNAGIRSRSQPMVSSTM